MTAEPTPAADTSFLLKPARLVDIEPIGRTSGGLYRATSSDSRCRLRPPSGRELSQLAPGQYEITAIILGIHQSVRQPSFFLKFEDEADSAGLAAEEISDGVFCLRVAIARPIAGVRLDPTTRNGVFLLGPVWIQPAPTSRNDAAPTIAQPKGKLRRAFWRIVELIMPPSMLRCRIRVRRLLQSGGGRLSAQEIVRRALSTEDRAAARHGLERAALRIATAHDLKQLHEMQRREAVQPHGVDWQDEMAAPVSSAACSVKVLAFYLPQFHPIPENDLWWGDGFTEWRNVAKAMPQFVGHRQPRRPAKLGYYDLRLLEVLRQQAELARRHGLHGFCFHHYWFGGRRLLERPVDQFFADSSVDLPFCLCWANENWTRRWDGADEDILIAQTHSPDDDLAFFHDLSRYLLDPRYVRIDGRPLLAVYRPSLLPDPAATAARWRKAAQEIGLPDLFLVATNAFGFTDYRSIGFDALVEFPPHGLTTHIANETLTFYRRDFDGLVHRYQDVTASPPPAYQADAFVFPGAMPGWDNEPRRPGRGRIFHGSTPDLFESWLAECLARAKRSASPGQRFVFINAWNEWAEGAYLEPDHDFGYGYLNAVARCVRRHADVAVMSQNAAEG